MGYMIQKQWSIVQFLINNENEINHWMQKINTLFN